MWNEWTKKIKPYIIQFFPKSKNHIFEENRDIHYIVGLIDKLKKEYDGDVLNVISVLIHFV